MKKEELKRLFNDEKFIKKISEVDSVEKLQQFLAENNLNMSIEEINKAIKSDAELTEKDLGDITGGAWFSWLNFAWKCFTWGMIECE